MHCEGQGACCHTREQGERHNSSSSTHHNRTEQKRALKCKRAVSDRRRGGASLQQNSMHLRIFHCSFCKHINTEGTVEMFKSPLGKHHNNNYFKQEPLIHAIIGRQKYEKHNIYVISKHLPITYIY